MTNIENNVPLPATKKPRGRKPKATESGLGAIGLIKALEFITTAQREAGTPYQTHCIINNHWCVAFDGALTIGCKVEEDVKACPNSYKLLAALKKCGINLSISQLNENILAIKSEKFKASIDCIRLEDMPMSGIDDPVATINDNVRLAFEALAWIVIEGAEKPWAGAVLLQSGSAVATNGHVLLEFWHGCELPPGLLIPKVALNAVIKCGKKLSKLGFSEQSATFYFEDNSFIKTQLYKDKYPNYAGIFERFAGDLFVLPKDFYEGVKAVCGFAEGKFIKLAGNKIQSHETDERGATYDCEGLPQMILNFEYLKAVETHFSNTQFGKEGVSFSNGNVRGIIAKSSSI